MKIAKKILSVLLAVVMVLSTFAVAVSAVGTKEGAIYNASISLKATVGTTKFTSKTSVDLDEAKLSTPTAGTVEVEAGDTVWVYVYASTDYFIQSFNAQVIYSAGLLDPRETLSAQTGYKITSMKTEISASDMEKFYVWNTNSLLVQSFSNTPAAVVANPYQKLQAENLEGQANVAKAWPSDSTGKILSAYADSTGIAADLSKWHVTRVAYIPGEKATACMLLPGLDLNSNSIDDSEEHIIKFPLTVPADAAGGTTYTITIPDESVVRADKTTAFTTIPELAFAEEDYTIAEDEDTRYEDIPGYDVKAAGVINVTSLTGTGKAYGDDFYFDTTNATLTVKVKKSSGTSLSWDGLETVVNTYKDYAQSSFTSTSPWTAFATALSNAQTELTNHAKTSQTDIDALGTALSTAAGNLVAKADYTNLDNAITAADAITSSTGYTVASWSAFTTARTAAKNANRDLPATSQSSVDTLTSNLTNAQSGLTGIASYTQLDTLVTSLEQKITDKELVEAWYTEASWSAFQTALSNAKNVDRDLAAADQSTIDTLYNNLSAASTESTTGLVEDDASYTDLDAAITLAGTKTQTDYEATSWNTMQTKLTAANNVSRTLKAKSQGTIDKAATELNTAIQNLVALGGAVYTGLDDALETCVPTYDEDYYTESTWSAYETALDAATAISRELKSTQQASVDKAETDLENAFAGLQLKPANYTEVDNQINRYDLEDSDVLALYTSDSITALSNAISAVNRDLDITQQTTVDGYATAIKNAADAMAYKPATTKPLDDALAAVANYKEANYTEASWKTLSDAVTAGENLLDKKPLDIRDNSDIEDKAEAITTAIENLKALGADYGKLTAALSAYGEIEEGWYTPTSWSNSGIEDAYSTASEIAPGLDVTYQDTIDNAAKALTDAIALLVEANADYTALNSAKTTAASKKEYKGTAALGALYMKQYTDSTWAAFDEAYTAAKAVATGLKKKDQSTITTAATNLSNAITALAFADFDYSIYDDLTEDVKAQDQYTAASWSTYDTALKAVVSGYKMDNYTNAVKDYNAVKTAISNLVDAGPANYKAVEDAIKNGPEDADETLYTPTSWSLYKDELAKIDWDLNENYQETVDGYVKLVEDAIEMLVPAAGDADYTGLDDAINAVKTYTEATYTKASWKVLSDAVTAGNAVSRDLTDSAADQKIVDDAEGAIRDAIDGLKTLANYAGLTAAIADAGKLEEKNYTPASWKAFQDLVTAGKNVDPDLSTEDQKTIDDAAAAITDGIKDVLAVKPAEAKGLVMESECTPAKNGELATFQVRVDARAMMVQFVGRDAGDTTRSYDRRHANVSIKSYNAQGDEVGPYAVDIAYEIWTINTKLEPGKTTIRVKDNGSSVWEDKDQAYDFTYVPVKAKASLISAELAATEGTQLGPVDATIVTGPEAIAVQLMTAPGCTITFTADKATTNDDKNLVFDMRAWMCADGVNTVTVRILSTDGWEDAGTMTYTVTLPTK